MVVSPSVISSMGKAVIAQAAVSANGADDDGQEITVSGSLANSVRRGLLWRHAFTRSNDEAVNCL